MSSDYFKLYKSLGMTSDSHMASALQRAVIADDEDHLAKGLDLYTEEQKTQAIVHTRQDVVLLVSYVSAINTKIARAVTWLKIIASLLLLLLVAYVTGLSIGL